MDRKCHTLNMLRTKCVGDASIAQGIRTEWNSLKKLESGELTPPFIGLDVRCAGVHCGQKKECEEGWEKKMN